MKYCADIDKNVESIDTAKTNPELNYENIFFLAGDALDIEKHILKLMAFGKEVNIQSKETVTISSGFLTRQVVTPQVAFEIFQKVTALYDNIFISGLTETLIVRRDAKNCGMNITNKIYLYLKKPLIIINLNL